MAVSVWHLYWQVRNCKKMKIWRQQVFERDNGTCQKCGRRENKVERYTGSIQKSPDGSVTIIPVYNPRKRLTPDVHHKKSVGFLLEFYEIKTLSEALKCRQLWDIRNGVTLCRDCHGKEETATRFSVFRCKDCYSLIVGLEKLLTHQQRTGHSHHKKLGLYFDLPYEEKIMVRAGVTNP